jgi:hypothetical protein
VNDEIIVVCIFKGKSFCDRFSTLLIDGDFNYSIGILERYNTLKSYEHV